MVGNLILDGEDREMKNKSLLIIPVIILFLVSSLPIANAVFGLSACEKVKKQALSDQKIIKSLAENQAALIKTRDKQIAKQGLLVWTGDPSAVKEEDIKNLTLAGHRKILTSFQNLQRNQGCLKPDKSAEALSLIESYMKVVTLWSGPRAPYLSSDLIKYGDLSYYLK